MKRRLTVSLLILLVLNSCQKEDIKVENAEELNFPAFKEDWGNSEIQANLFNVHKNTACYLFPGQNVNRLLRSADAEYIRFVLGIAGGKLDIKAQSVDMNGVSLGIINSSVSFNKAFDDSINALSVSGQVFSGSGIVGEHLLQPREAYEYINRWNTSLSENRDLSSVVSYDNQRIRHFSIEKEVIEEILHFRSFNYLGVLLGINPEGKLTTVLVGLDARKNIILPPVHDKGGGKSGAIYDFTSPCPNTCK